MLEGGALLVQELARGLWQANTPCEGCPRVDKQRGFGHPQQGTAGLVEVVHVNPVARSLLGNQLLHVT